MVSIHDIDPEEDIILPEDKSHTRRIMAVIAFCQIVILFPLLIIVGLSNDDIAARIDMLSMPIGAYLTGLLGVIGYYCAGSAYHQGRDTMNHRRRREHAR